ncbi:unnamed protein product [Gadus morhua 'NCC']
MTNTDYHHLLTVVLPACAPVRLRSTSHLRRTAGTERRRLRIHPQKNKQRGSHPEGVTHESEARPPPLKTPPSTKRRVDTVPHPESTTTGQETDMVVEREKEKRSPLHGCRRVKDAEATLGGTDVVGVRAFFWGKPS